MKIENPAQLQGFRNCIEKCQALRRQGQLPHTTKSKNSLLLCYQDEMRTPTSQHKFKRASTTVDRTRQRHPMRRKLSYQQSLPSIGEEGLRGKPKESADVAPQRDRKKQFDSRPTFLKFTSPPPDEARGKRTAVVMKGEDVKKKLVHVPTEESLTKITSSSDVSTPRQPTSQSATNIRPKKSALRKHIANSTPANLSPLNSPPAETSPRLKRRLRKTPKSQLTDKPRHNPPLGQLKNDSKFTSSEFQADVEDFDALSPQSTASITDIGERTRDADSCTTAVNEAALDLESELESTAHLPHSITVHAEVHLDAHERPASIPLARESPVSALAQSPSLIPPPPTSRPSSRSGSLSPSHFHSPSPLASPSSPSLNPSLCPPVSATQDSFYSQDLNHSSDLLIPRSRSSSSPPPLPRVDLPFRGSSPGDTETDTDTLLPHLSSSASGRKASSLTTQKKKLSFERRQGNGSKSGTIFLNKPGLGQESDC